MFPEAFIYIGIFILSCTVFYFSGSWIIGGVSKISYRFGWREFVLAFLVMAFTSSLPNFFVGITSALKGVPELSFGDVIGGNLIALTVAAPLALFFSVKKEITAASRTVQWSLFFTLGAALLPSVLVFNGVLTRVDGVILISFFFAYVIWLFYKRERFILERSQRKKEEVPSDSDLNLRDVLKILVSLVLIVIAAQGIVISATYFAEGFGLSLLMIGVLIVGVGNSLPQIYFASTASFKGDNWMLLGCVMGSVVIPATLVLGLVSLMSPIPVDNVDVAMAGRIFLVVAAIVFFFSLKTSQKLVVQEALLLLAIYGAFLGYVFFVH
ncbi:MAG: sodium:calcium antiporter [Candidatus Paceibacterota bacterium]